MSDATSTTTTPLICVLATNGSPASHEAVRQARHLVAQHAHFLLVTVVPEREDPMAYAGGFESGGMTEEEADERFAAAQDRAHHALEETRAVFGGTVEEHVLAAPGEPAEALVRYATEVGADLIVVGSRHHSALGRLFRGSVSDQVAHHAPCPVLVVPEPEHAT